MASNTQQMGTGTNPPATPQTSNPLQMQTRNAPPTGNASAPKPFVPAKFELPMLDDDSDNYEVWSTTLTLALGNRGLWSIVNGTEPALDLMTDAAAHEEWLTKDQEAKLMILLALKKVGQKCVFRAKTSKDYWDRLSTCYSGGGDDRRTVSLLEQVLGVSLKDSEPLQQQLDNIVFAAQQLEAAGLPIGDKVLAYHLALHLPNSYATLRTILTSSDATKISSKWVVDQVITEEHHRITQSGGAASTFYAKANKGKSTQGNSNSNIKCSHCKKKGHKKAECRKLKREKEEVATKASNNAAGSSSGMSRPSNSTSSGNAVAKIAVSNASPPPYDSPELDIVRLFHAVAVPCWSRPAERPLTTCEHVLQAQVDSDPQSIEDGWIIDSGASHNMCACHDWFHHYSLLTSPIDVVLGDDSAIQATGVGRISVNMHANGNSMPVVLQDILHVPELHGNLLSVSHFARHGAEVRFVGEGCSILDQLKHVACEGNLHGNLYLMCITTISSLESAHITVLPSFPTEGKDPPEAALIAENSGSKVSIDIWHR